MSVFTPDEMEEIIAQAVSAQLHNEPRNLLLAGVGRADQDSLDTTYRNSNRQMQGDLHQMNDDGEIEPGRFPLAQWLKNASFQRGDRPAFQKFFREKAELAFDRARQQAPAVVVSPSTVAAGSAQERFLFKSELLPVSYLNGAVRTASSVCRIELDRIENGTAVMIKDSPYTVSGTGWLIGKRFVITNHHVVSAREAGEPLATCDLQAQVRGARIVFDFDNPDQKLDLAAAIPVVGLRVNNPALDYAIIELGESPGPAPLRLRDEALTITADARFATNIIQHPGGASKQVAIRNNLAVGIVSGDLIYYTDTDKGSSGSPVCDDEWRVVALHKASSRKFGNFNYQGKTTAWINYGTPIKRIVDHLRGSEDPSVKALWQEMEPVFA